MGCGFGSSSNRGRCCCRELDASDIDEDLISSRLATAGQPDPDLIIRTGGESRISNFMLWQAAYAEIYVTQTLWPDFAMRISMPPSRFSVKDETLWRAKDRASQRSR